MRDTRRQMHCILGERERANMAETCLAVSQDERLVALAIPQQCFCSMVFPCHSIVLSRAQWVLEYFGARAATIYRALFPLLS